MDKKFYNILWIDDEHEGMSGFKGDAKFNDIQLVPFKSLNKGISELKKNYPIYDGVLLDAKFFEFEDDVKGSEDSDNVHRAKEELLLLPKKFEVFVLTGQAEAYEDRTFNKAFKKVYKKGIDADIEKLYKEIKSAANKLPDTQIRHEYNRVFDVCTERYIGEYAAQDLINLLKINSLDYVDKNLTKIRDVMQDIFTCLSKYKLLPSDFVHPQIALNESSKFLSGKNYDGTYFIERDYKHLDETHLPTQIATNIKTILAITQPGAHRSKIDDHIRGVATPYLMQSVLYQLLDVIIWLKQHIDSNPKTNNWERVNVTTSNNPDEIWIEGEVINYDSVKGFAFLSPFNGSENQFIPPHLVTFHSLNDGMKVKGEIEEYTDNRTQESKKRIKTISLK